MLTRTAHDPRFSADLPETFGVSFDWDPSWGLRWMDFQFSKGRVVTMYHITYRPDYAYRYTIFFDPDTGAWANWEQAF
jgi:hypothetical protein